MSETFEIHVTGSIETMQQASTLGIKTITIDLLKPDKSHYRTEYMTSHLHECDNYQQCQEYINEILSFLSGVVRVKIECPKQYTHYIPQSVYMEIHGEQGYNNIYPMSLTRGKMDIMITDREYDKDKYSDLIKRHVKSTRNLITELCIFDSNVDEDKDWFDLYKGTN